ncbi:MAG: hypothetical protein IIC69_03270 [Nanoarchaeota archaeon]|nr:hypothetical protein [Nanoarchaeota archaeon]
MEERVQQLAETLKKSGLAASMSEAIQKAKSILNIDLTKSSGQKEENPGSPDYNIKNEDATLNELMKEVNVTPEQVEAHKQERLDDAEAEIFNIKKDIKQAEKNPEKVEQIKEEVEKVKDEINKITEDTPKEKEEDMFKEEKKIDLNKLFGNK